MLRLLCLLSWCAAALGGHAQTPASYARPAGPLPDPVFVLNSTVIVNGLLAEFTEKKNQAITSMRVYKGPDSRGSYGLPAHLKSLSPDGLIDLVSAKRMRSQSFPHLGRRLGLRGPLVFALNGYPLDPLAVAAVRIAPAAIGQIHIVRPTAEVAETRVDIWLVPPPKPDTSQYPPGTIFLR